jgi:hypothetical protein
MASAVPGQQYPAGGGAVANNGQQPPHTNSGNGVAAVPDSYFTESRKGEINELRNLLKGFAAERDNSRKRDIIKKVIAYMTLGIDVSRLFTEMMLAIETRYVRRKLFIVVVVIGAAAAARIVLLIWGREKVGWSHWNLEWIVSCFLPPVYLSLASAEKTLTNSSVSSTTAYCVVLFI